MRVQPGTVIFARNGRVYQTADTAAVAGSFVFAVCLEAETACLVPRPQSRAETGNGAPCSDISVHSCRNGSGFVLTVCDVMQCDATWGGEI